MVRGAWCATVHGVIKSQTQLKRLSTHIYIHTHTHISLLSIYLYMMYVFVYVYILLQILLHYRILQDIEYLVYTPMLYSRSLLSVLYGSVSLLVPSC